MVPHSGTIGIGLFYATGRLFGFSGTITIGAKVQYYAIFVNSSGTISCVFLGTILRIVSVMKGTRFRTGSPYVVGIVGEAANFFSLFASVFIVGRLRNGTHYIVSRVLNGGYNGQTIGSSTRYGRYFIDRLFLPGEFTFVDGLSTRSSRFIGTLSYIYSDLVIGLSFLSTIIIGAIMGVGGYY